MRDDLPRFQHSLEEPTQNDCWPKFVKIPPFQNEDFNIWHEFELDIHFSKIGPVTGYLGKIL